MTSKKYVFLKRVAPLMLCAIGAFCVMENFLQKAPDQNNGNAKRALETRARRRLYNDAPASNLPAWTDTFANVWDPYDSSSGDIPAYWYTAKSGGATVMYTFSFCMGLVLANHLVPLDQRANETNPDLEVVDVGAPATVFPFPQRRYVNIRTETTAALTDAASRGLASSGLADVIATPYISFAGDNLFTSANKARGFAMFRHPAKRAIDQFFYRQHATFDSSSWKESVALMELEQYVKSDELIENYEVRSLLQLPQRVDLTEADVQLAKEILRQKFIVGIFEWYEVSVIRYEKFFGWWDELDVLNNYTINHCHFRVVETIDHIGSFPKVNKAEEIDNILKTRMWADVELYHYAKILFNEQEELLS